MTNTQSLTAGSIYTVVTGSFNGREILQQRVAGCVVCDKATENGTLPFISHFNCLYTGRVKSGHDCGRSGHCTADACY